MESKAKRMRSTNWDSSDKILLRQLIEERIEIVENKSVDTNTSRKKKDAWLEITNSFNNMSAEMRETSQLQSQWRTTKTFKRKINYKNDEYLKKELFNTAMDNRRAERKFIEREHKQKLKSILMERNEKLKTLQMERAEKEKTLQMERRHKKEIHQLKLRRLEEENFNF